LHSGFDFGQSVFVDGDIVNSGGAGFLQVIDQLSEVFGGLFVLDFSIVQSLSQSGEESLDQSNDLLNLINIDFGGGS